jgi:hypothetical protein
MFITAVYMGRRLADTCYPFCPLIGTCFIDILTVDINSRRDERLFPASRCVTHASLRANRCDLSQAEPRKELRVFGEGKQPPENTFTFKRKAK